MGAGLIYAAIVAVWAAILAPTLIKRSDPLPEPILQARNSSGIRVLGRRRPRAHARAVLGRGASARPTARPTTARSSGGGRVAPPAPGSRGQAIPRHADLRGPAGSPPVRVQRTARSVPRRAARSGSSTAAGTAAAGVSASTGRAPLARRRRLVGTLAILVVGGVVGGQTAGLPAWAPAVPALGLVAYVLHVRRQARRSQERRRRQHAVDLRRLAARRRAEAAVAAAVEQAAWVAPQAVRPGTIHADGSWEPMRIPLPTYVTAPVVRRPPARVVSVGAEGAWTSGQLTDLMSGFRGQPGVNASAAFSSRAPQPWPGQVAQSTGPGGMAPGRTERSPGRAGESPTRFPASDAGDDLPAAQDGSTADRPRPRAVNE
ncbi:MAG TPA: hypothetical protein VII16_15555 [Actinomycetes bacterium]